MVEEHLSAQERLLARAMAVLDQARSAGTVIDAWSFGGGGALMRRYRHRVSSGIDIFVADRRRLGTLTPRLNDALAALSPDCVEEADAVRFYFPEGEIAFIACGFLTPDPVVMETIRGRAVPVETSAEILAKKLRHRGAAFGARDLFDLAAIASREPDMVRTAGGFLDARRSALLARVRDHDAALREDFAALDVLEFRPSYDDCLAALHAALARIPGPPRVEQTLAGYRVVRREGIGALAPHSERARRCAALRARRFFNTLPAAKSRGGSALAAIRASVAR